uniref:Pyridoxal kinase isoform X1 n=1 Tax=Rhizophora mucronata TaxID=61149 RepID=A0A2P2QD09_RHIMU
MLRTRPDSEGRASDKIGGAIFGSFELRKLPLLSPKLVNRGVWLLRRTGTR